MSDISNKLSELEKLITQTLCDFSLVCSMLGELPEFLDKRLTEQSTLIHIKLKALKELIENDE